MTAPAAMAVSRSSATARLPHRTSEPDQARLSAVDVAFAAEEVGAGRPAGDCTCAGQVLVVGARRDVGESLPCRGLEEHDRQTKCPGASFDDAAGPAESKRGTF